MFKICGLRDADNALVAAEAGASYLGFNFVPGVRRQISVEQARAIIMEYRRRLGPGSPPLVGLFADQPLAEVNETVRLCGLDLVQLCGREPPEYWDQVDTLVIKQIRVRDTGPRERVVHALLRQVDQVVSGNHVPLLDSHETGSLGGTGRSFDWNIARDIAAEHEIVLAGGLTPGNVGEAIRTVAPWGVDVSSGVETDGVKDTTKIRAFAAEVFRAYGEFDPDRRPIPLG